MQYYITFKLFHTLYTFRLREFFADFREHSTAAQRTEKQKHVFFYCVEEKDGVGLKSLNLSCCNEKHYLQVRKKGKDSNEKRKNQKR